MMPMIRRAQRETHTRIDRAWLPRVRYCFIVWKNDETDIIDDETGCVFYTTPTTALALERAIAYVRRHSITIRRIDLTPSREVHEMGNCPHCGAWVNFAQEAELAKVVV